MNTDRLLPVLKTVQIVVDGLVVAIGLVVLSLSANLISFTNKHRGDDVSVKFYWHGKAWDQGQTYLPPNFDVVRPVLLIVTGSICMLVNGALLAWRFRRGALNTNSESRKAYLRITAAIAIALLFTLAVTIYSWLQILAGQHTNDWIWRFRDGSVRPIIWNNSVSFDPLSWNCALYPYLYPNDGFIYSRYDYKGSLQKTLRGLCHQGFAAVDLLLALPLLEAAALSLQVWVEKKGIDRTRRQLKDGEPDAYKMDDLHGLVQGAAPQDHVVRI